MYCHNCGAELQDNALFCDECGARQENDSPMAVPYEFEKKGSKPKYNKRKVIIVTAVSIIVTMIIGIIAFNAIEKSKIDDLKKETIAYMIDFDLEAYRYGQKVEIKKIAKELSAKVKKAEKTKDVKEVKKNFDKKISKIKTNKQLLAEELEAYKKDFIKKIKETDVSIYDEENRNKVKSEIENYIRKIKVAKTIKAVDELGSNFIITINQIQYEISLAEENAAGKLVANEEEAYDYLISYLNNIGQSIPTYVESEDMDSALGWCFHGYNYAPGAAGTATLFWYTVTEDGRIYDEIFQEYIY